MPRSVMRKRAHQRAMQQFVAQDIYTTAGHTGVLLFVSVAERYAEIVVDCEVHQKVPDEEWKVIIDQLTADIGSGRPVKGLIDAIGPLESIWQSTFRRLRRKRTFYRTTSLC